MKVVLGGSRKLAFMPEEVLARLEAYMNKDAEFLVGDAPGIDSKFQEILKLNNYKNVTVLSSAGVVRNNLGNWKTRLIDSGLKTKSAAMHTAKDRIMTAEAEYGVMVWDKESPGTLANVIDLVKSGKSCLLYIAGDNELIQIETGSVLETLLSRYSEISSEAEKRLNAYDRRQNKKLNLETNQSLFD
jgi:hypothetical protein